MDDDDLLCQLSSTEREVIRRFYLLGHDSKRIQKDLGMNEDDQRDLRSRVKALMRRSKSRPVEEK